MRLVLGMVLAGLAALPLGVSAQAGEEGTEPSAEEPVLRLDLADDSVGLAPGSYRTRTVDGYTLEEMELRVKRARIGVGVSAIPIFFGTVVALGSAFSGGLLEETTPEEGQQNRRATAAGTVVAACGALSMIATGALLGVRKRKRREPQEAHYGTPRRVQWDLARSRLVF